MTAKSSACAGSASAPNATASSNTANGRARRLKMAGMMCPLKHEMHADDQQPPIALPAPRRDLFRGDRQCVAAIEVLFDAHADIVLDLVVQPDDGDLLREGV